MDDFFEDNQDRELRNRLKVYYSDEVPLSISWLQENRDVQKNRIALISQLQFTTANYSTIADLQEIIDKIHRSKLKRILIEGQTGFGKTTLARKLIFDWGKRHWYMSHFQLAFLIPLREIRGHNVEKAILSICKNCGYKRTINVEDFNKTETLLILDGFDELSNDSRKEIVQILYQKKYSEMTVVITSRKGVCSMQNEDFLKTLPDDGQSKEFYDGKVTLLGLTIEDMKKLIQNYFNNKQTNEILQKFESWPEETARVLRSPLLIMLFAILFNRMSGMIFKKNLADIYKSFFNNITAVYIERRGRPVSQSFDLFSGDRSSLKRYRKKLAQFGQICLQKLSFSDYTFEESRLTKELFDIGFLMRREPPNGVFGKRNTYESLHVSFSEFAAAYFLWFKFIQESSFSRIPALQKLYQFSLSELEALDRIYSNSLGSSQIYDFLLNFFGKHRQHLFKQLMPNPIAFRDDNKKLWETVAKLKGSKKLLKTLSIYVDRNIYLDHHVFSSLLEFFCSSDFTDIVTELNRFQKIKKLTVDNSISFNWPSGLAVPELLVLVKKLPTDEINHEKGFRNVLCSQLFYEITIHWKPEDDMAGSEMVFKQFLECSSSRIANLKFESQSSADSARLEHSISAGVLKDVNFQLIEVAADTDLWLRWVSHLLESHRIAHLRIGLTNNKGDELQHLFQLIASCESLTSLEVYSHGYLEVKINIHLLVVERKKEWKCLNLQVDGELFCPENCGRCKDFKNLDCTGRENKNTRGSHFANNGRVINLSLLPALIDLSDSHL